MNRFEEQLLERSRLDQELLEKSMSSLTSSLLQKNSEKSDDDSLYGCYCTEIERICRYYKVPSQDRNTTLPEKEDQLLDVLLRPSGMMRRWIALDGKWFGDGDGAILAFFRNNGKLCCKIIAYFGSEFLCVTAAVMQKLFNKFISDCSGKHMLGGEKFVMKIFGN